MGKLIDDIGLGVEWIVKCFKSDNILLDYTLNSLDRIDQFISDNSTRPGVVKPNSTLSSNFGPIMFSIGCYVGETIIKNTPGASWQTNDDESDDSINNWIKLPDNSMVYPVQKVMKRFHNGEEDSIAFYGKVLSSEFNP